MSDEDLHIYEIWCNDENQYVSTAYQSDEPTVCPHVNTHSVDINNINILNTISSNIITIKDDDSDVQGLWKGKCITFTASDSGGSTTIHDIFWPYNVKGLSATILPSSDNVGDYLSTFTAPDTDLSMLIPGSSLISSDISSGNTIIGVNPLLFSFMKLGHLITLKENSTEEEVGECIDIDKVNNTITVSIPTVSSFTVAGGAKIIFTIPRIMDLKIAGLYPIFIGETKIGASLLPKGIKLRFLYKNNGNYPKEISIFLQLLN